MMTINPWMITVGFLLASGEAGAVARGGLRPLFEKEITSRYPSMKVQLMAQPRWADGTEDGSAEIHRLVYSGESAPGQYLIHADVTDATGGRKTIAAGVAFKVLTDGYVARRRVLPGETLKADDFELKSIDVSTGPVSALRALIVRSTEVLGEKEATQTIVEGQPLLSSSIQKIPDVRRGAIVRLRLIAGDVALVTSAKAEEQGYVNGKIKVTATSTRRLLEGSIAQDGAVEVRL